MHEMVARRKVTERSGLDDGSQIWPATGGKLPNSDLGRKGRLGCMRQRVSY